ncbi:hypothetical protein [Nocardioides sp. SYSU DS0651]|uniref:hypothetical protein n=1 Tax=Nocardioides sp. SYSU DS0651 TaxID=3415955 RepID=UPI003F4B2AF2
MTKRPPAVEIATWLLWFLVAAGLVVCVLVVVYRDDLGMVWSPMQDGDSTVQPVEFVPVILVLYGVTAVLAATLIPLFRHGHNWARHSLAAIVVGIFLVTVATVRTAPPTMVKWSAIAAAVVSAVTLVFVWHPQSRHFVREAAYPPEERERRAADRDGARGS